MKFFLIFLFCAVLYEFVIVFFLHGLTYPRLHVLLLIVNSFSFCTHAWRVFR